MAMAVFLALDGRLVGVQLVVLQSYQMYKE